MAKMAELSSFSFFCCLFFCVSHAKVRTTHFTHSLDFLMQASCVVDSMQSRLVLALQAFEKSGVQNVIVLAS
jgi:hypothetical protein